jgi:DNA polymerase III subunit alpha
MEKTNLPFVHLHVHSEYSMLDGVSKISSIVEKVKSLGMNSVALSDHGVMYGVYEFWKACNVAGIKPIIGCEIYVSPKEKELKQEVDGIKYYHLLLLAKNLKGYRNLIKLVSESHLKGFYYKPRADKELLTKYSEGLICTSACPASPLGRHIARDELPKAVDWLNFLHETYKDDFYLEVQRHGLLPNDEIPKDLPKETDIDFLKEQAKINKQILKWSKEYNIPLIATTDSHYLNDEDSFTQEVLFAIKDGKTLNDVDRRKGYKHTYIKTQDELAQIFFDIPEVMTNTQSLADKVESFDITFKRIQPVFPDVPNGMTSADFIREQALEGAKRKYKNVDESLIERINYELSIINQKGYDDYFLVVSDIMKWARANNIIVGVRGSAGGSVVAYCLDIVNTDPIRWELYFERMLNPQRESPPDIDMDIQDSRRDELLDYVKNKYGAENVSGIAAFGRLKTRNAIRDVSRVMGVELSIADSLSKLVEVKFGKPKSIQWMIEHNKEFAAIVNSDERIQKVATVVQKIDGLCRHISTHPCGHILTPQVITDYVAVQFESGSSEKVITQMENVPLEDLGLMKFDFLGLSNLSIIDYALKLIKKRHNLDLDIYSVSQDDKKTFELFQKGHTTSVFQFESSGMKRYLKDLHPETLDDLCFMAAAYRPGPMQFIEPYIKCKHGEREPEYLIPELKPILQNTYGYAIYQEQVIRIAVDIAGYSMGQADLLRRAMGKKKKEIMDAEKEKFVKGCIEKGFTQEIGEKLFDYMLPFVDYGFNKSHSAAYAIIGYWTAYLKAHFPIEFMAARLTADMSHPDKLIVALDETRELGVKLLPPDINKSLNNFVPDGNDSIFYGLDGIKNVGANVVEEIINERSKNGDYKSLDDFCFRVKSASGKTLEALIKVGAMNAFGDIGALLQIYQNVLTSAAKEAQRLKSGQLGLMFSAVETTDDTVTIASTPMPTSFIKITTAQKLFWEKELLGMYFSAHPIQGALAKIRELKMPLLSECNLTDKENITAAGLVSKLKVISTKSGEPMAFVQIQDTSRELEGVIFPKDLLNWRAKFKEGDVVSIKGRCNLRNGELGILISKICSLDLLIEESGIKIDDNLIAPVVKQKTLIIHHSSTADDLRQLRDLLAENPGDMEVFVQIGDVNSKKFKMKNGVKADLIDSVVSKLPMVQKVI